MLANSASFFLCKGSKIWGADSETEFQGINKLQLCLHGFLKYTCLDD